MKGLALALALAVALGATGGLHAEPATAAAERARAGVVTVLVERDDGARARGLGFVVDGRRVVTTWGLVHDARRVRLDDGEGRVEVVGFTALDVDRDLVVLAVDEDLPQRPLGLARRLPRPGDGIYVVNPRGPGELEVARGVVDEVTGGATGGVRLAVPLYRGARGGPVVDGRGEVVGVIAPEAGGGRSPKLAVPVGELRAVLDARGPVRPLEDLALSDRDRPTRRSRPRPAPGTEGEESGCGWACETCQACGQGLTCNL